MAAALSPRTSPAGRTADAAILVLLGVAGYLIGAAWITDYRSVGQPQAFYQSELSPAIAAACGRGYVALRYEGIEPLRQFLQQQTTTFSCDALPSSLPVTDLTAFQAISRYLQLTIALAWKARGISWQSLDPLLATANAVVGMTAYGLFRLGFAPGWALAGALLVLLSPANLWNLPHLRDYLKAPFLLGILLVTGALVRRPRTTRAALALSAAGGAVLGVGLGFRNDLLLAVVPLVLSVGVLSRLEGAPTLRTRALMLACTAAAFVATAYPILRSYGRASNTPHVILLGLMSPFDAELGIVPSVYGFGYTYNDQYASLLVRGVVERTRPVTIFGTGQPGYDADTADYLRRIAATFPADFVARAYAAAARIFETPFLRHDWAPTWLRSWVYEPVRIRAGLVRRAGWAVWIGTAAGIGLALATRPAAGVWLLMAVAIFGGGAALQYQPRHIFYLEVFPIAALITTMWLAKSAVTWSVRRGWRERSRSVARTAGLALAAVLALVAAFTGLLWAARVVQEPRARQLLESYTTAPAELVEYVPARSAAGRVLVPVPPRASDPWPRVMSLLRVSVGGPQCGDRIVPIRFSYPPDVPYWDFTHDVAVRVRHGAPTMLVMPVFDVPRRDLLGFAGQEHGIDFRGLVLDARDLVCLSGLERISDESRLSVPLSAVLTDGWRERPLYQTLAR